MNQEKIGNFIKDIRKKNNLTQKELADKLGVTYQAVSKWENGLNIPDIGIIRQISKMYDVDINEILDCKKNSKKFNKLIIVIICLILILGISVFIIVKNKDNNNIELKTISTKCSDFRINGSMAYNKKKATLQISEIDYCGVSDDTLYNSISCNLYEEKDGNEVLINACNSLTNTTLEEYLKETRIKVNNYSSTCKVITDAKMYLKITANTGDENKEYIIPINLDDDCTK